MKQPPRSRTELAGSDRSQAVWSCSCSPGLWGNNAAWGKAAAGPETLLQARLTCSTGTLQSRTRWKTAGLGGFWVVAGAAVLQIWGDRCRRVCGFLGKHSPKGLGISETLFAKKHCQKPRAWGSLPCGHTRRSRNEALPFFCGLFVVSFYEFPSQSWALPMPGRVGHSAPYFPVSHRCGQSQSHCMGRNQNIFCASIFII